MSDAQDREIAVSRVLDAPPDRVWRALTDPRQLPHWWGPRGFTTTVQEMDLRPGGAWNFVMHGPGAMALLNRSVFTEIVQPERVAYTNGRGSQGSTAGDFDSVLEIEPIGDADRTRMNIRMVFPSAFFRNQFARDYNALEAGKQTLDRLADHLRRSVR
jgi:uncharacterized protein YndB with AHSA1/START domain